MLRVIYFFIRLSPAGWWLPAGAVFALVIVGLTNLAPILLLPLFYTLKPLARESLRVRLVTMAERAGARVLGVYEWGLAEKTRKANAALTGIGSTRRILVSDTMLAEYSEDEIEVVMAHELAHHVHGDIWKGIVFEGLLILAGFFAAARVFPRGRYSAAGPTWRACRAWRPAPSARDAAGGAPFRVYERADRFLAAHENPGALSRPCGGSAQNPRRKILKLFSGRSTATPYPRTHAAAETFKSDCHRPPGQLA